MSALFRLLKKPPVSALGILGFHQITPTPAQPFLSPRFPELFESLCKKLAARYDCVTIGEAAARLRERRFGSRPMVAIIFDDGYADVATTIAPILRRVGVPATSFVIVNCLVTGELPWYEELGRIVYETPRDRFRIDLGSTALEWSLPPARRQRESVYWEIVRKLKTDFRRDLQKSMALAHRAHEVAPFDPAKSKSMLTVEGARAAMAAGIEIGCHSLSHPILPNLEDAEIEFEIAGGRSQLERLIGAPVRSFCFPNGDNDRRCVAAVEHAGYVAAVSMSCGPNHAGSYDPFRLRRVPMSESMTATWPWHTTLRVRTTLNDD